MTNTSGPLSPAFQAAYPFQQGGSGLSSEPSVDTVIIPVGGKGTRRWPGTFVLPKNLALLGAVPLVKYAVDEAVLAGAKNMVIVSSPSDLHLYQRLFNPTEEDLDDVSGKGKELQHQAMLELRELGKNVTFTVQEEALGLGHAVLQGKTSKSFDGVCEHEVIGSFGVILPDDVILNRALENSGLKSLTDTYQGGISVAREEVPAADTSRYGIFDFGGDVDPDLETQQVSRLVEKPKTDAPSNYAIMGRYILTTAVFDRLEDMVANGRTGAGDEYQLTDAIQEAIDAGELAYGSNYEGTRYDCGSDEGSLEAHIAIAPKQLAHLRHKKSAPNVANDKSATFGVNYEFSG